MTVTKGYSTSYVLGQSMTVQPARNIGSFASGTAGYPKQKDTNAIVGPNVSNVTSDNTYTVENGVANSDQLIPVDPVSIDTLPSSIAFFFESRSCN